MNVNKSAFSSNQNQLGKDMRRPIEILLNQNIKMNETNTLKKCYLGLSTESIPHAHL